MNEIKRKPDRLEKELEKFVICTMRNAYNADGIFVVTSVTGTMFAEALKALVQLRNGIETITILSDDEYKHLVRK